MSDWLVTICVGILAVGVIGTVWFYQMPSSKVYACSTDKEILPADVALQCKRLTKGQWWHRANDAPKGEK